MIGRNLWAFIAGIGVATLGGLIGLGGAEFRLPVLVAGFRIRILQAVVLNLIISLVTVTFSFVFRLNQVPIAEITQQTAAIVAIMSGSLIGSYLGVSLSTNLREGTLHRAVGILLIGLSGVLIGHDWILGKYQLVPFWPQTMVAVACGVGIGMVSSMLGVAGGELIIPTLVLLYAIDIKLAGSLSLLISGPTILMGLWRYHRKNGFVGIREHRPLIAWMAAGSIIGAFIGSALLPRVSSFGLHVVLGIVLLLSALKMLRHKVHQTPDAPPFAR